jgi:hypothetical protein
MHSRLRPPPPAGQSDRSLGSAGLVVRLCQAPSTHFGELTGVVEWLATGEQRAFRTPEELRRVLREWRDGPSAA